MFDSLELVSQSLELMFDSLEHRFIHNWQNIKLLPLQGVLLITIILKAMPWARSFWAFSPYLNHMRKFSLKKSSVQICTYSFIISPLLT